MIEMLSISCGIKARNSSPFRFSLWPLMFAAGEMHLLISFWRIASSISVGSLNELHGETHYGLVTSVRPSVCAYACFNSGTTGRIRVKFGRVLCQGGLPPNRTVEYSKIGSNKRAVEKVVRWDPQVVHSSCLSQNHVPSLTICWGYT